MEPESSSPSPDAPSQAALPKMRILRAWNGEILAALLLVLVGGALLHVTGESPRFSKSAPAAPPNRLVVRETPAPNANPSRVAVTDAHAQPHPSTIETNDPATIQAIRSIFDPDEVRRNEDAPRTHRRYDLRFDFVGSGFPHNIEVWDSPVGLLWKSGAGFYRPDGDLEALLAALPAIRTAQLIRSQSEKERELGRRLRDANTEELIDAVLKVVNSENETVGAFAAGRLLPLVAVHNFPTTSNLGLEIKRNQQRAAREPWAPKVRVEVTAALQRIRDAQGSDHQGTRSTTVYWLDMCLLELADQSTANGLAETLRSIDDPRFVDGLLDSLETIYGLPPTYRRRGMCGNSSAAEFAAFAAQENPRKLQAREDLLKWHDANGKKARPEQLDAVLEAWRPTLLELTAVRKNYYSYDAIPTRQFSRLLRIGRELVPAIEQRQRKISDLAERGGLEFIRAYLLGDCDKSLVEELLADGYAQQALGCQIIAVSGRRDWTRRLDLLQRDKLSGTPPAEFHDLHARLCSASAALWMTLDVEALPLLRAAIAAGCSNEQSERIVANADLPKR